MKRFVSLALTIGLTAAVVCGATAAVASVTNPADNPHEITVKGDDGKTYTDGQDTLPGFDDVECTYIPGAWFDFAANRVYYADGQYIPWTEWDRATGYQEWLAKQDDGGSTGSGGSTGGGGSGSGTTTGSTGTTTTSGTKTTTKPSGSTSGSHTSTSGTGTSTSGAGTGVATASGGSDPSATPAASASANPGATASANPTAVPSASAAAVAAPNGVVADGTAPATTSADAASVQANPAQGVGLLILVALAAVGAIAYAWSAIFHRGARKESTS